MKNRITMKRLTNPPPVRRCRSEPDREGTRGRLKTLLPAGLFLLLLGCRCGSQLELEEVKAASPQMGTMVEITVLGQDRTALWEAVSEAFQEINRIEAKMSMFREGSDVYRINQAAGQEPIQVAPEVFELIEQAVAIGRESDGAFDITVGVLKGLYSFDPEKPRLPSRKQIEAKLPLIGLDKIVLDHERQTVRLALPGMRLDLSGIAKGYAVDRAIAVLQGRGITMAMVNAGGDLRVIGKHGDRPWNVGIQHPRDKRELIARMEVSDLAVATSGDYEKYLVLNGRRYCHILSPKTGTPVQGCRSVTITAGTACLADALATTVFVLGPDKGMELIKKNPEVQGLIIDARGRKFATDGIKGEIVWLDE